MKKNIFTSLLLTLMYFSAISGGCSGGENTLTSNHTQIKNGIKVFYDKVTIQMSFVYNCTGGGDCMGGTAIYKLDSINQNVNLSSTPTASISQGGGITINQPGIYFINNYCNGGGQTIIVEEDVASSIVNTNLNQNLFNVFPNPVTDKLTLQSNLDTNSSIKIKIVNTIGETIYAEALDIMHNDEYKLDVSSFPAGIYFMEVASSLGITIKKIIKR